jgi:hypothetical protein
MRGLLALTLLWLAFGAAPAWAEWRRAESPNFIVYSEESEARVRERITLLEDFDWLLRSFTSVTTPPAANKLQVYLVGGSRELRVVRPMGNWVGGFYTASPHGVAAIVNREADAATNELLFHEYTHHFMMQYAPGAYPLWYVEGFAEYFSSAQLSERTISVGGVPLNRGYSLVMESWLPIETVLFGTLAGLTNEQSAQFYAQGWLITHYFSSTPERQESLRRYLTAVNEGGSADALQSATGMTPRELVQELRRYVGRGRISYISVPRSSAQAAPPIAVTRLPRAADALLLHDAALRIGLSDGTADTVLRQIREAASRFGEDSFAQRVLARAEALYGDEAAADRLLDGLLAQSPNDAELMYLKGMRHLRAAEKAEDWSAPAREARRWFARAHRADANHFQTLYRFSQSMEREPDYVSENTMNILLLAHQLAPQVAQIRVSAATMLMNRDMFEPAEVLLRPLAADPHDAELAQTARQLLERARARQRPQSAETATE